MQLSEVSFHVMILLLFQQLINSRELVETPDGGLICLDWLDSDDNDKLYPDAAKRPTVLIMPGLTGMSCLSCLAKFILQFSAISFVVHVFAFLYLKIYVCKNRML